MLTRVDSIHTQTIQYIVQFRRAIYSLLLILLTTTTCLLSFSFANEYAYINALLYTWFYSLISRDCGTSTKLYSEMPFYLLFSSVGAGVVVVVVIRPSPFGIILIILKQTILLILFVKINNNNLLMDCAVLCVCAFAVTSILHSYRRSIMKLQ